MKKTLLTIFAMAGLVVLFAGPANADSIMLGPASFIVGQPGVSTNIHHTHTSALQLYTDSEYRYFYAPVNLPQGARITSVVIFYEDDDTNNIRIKLKRKNMYTATQQDMCEWTSSVDTSGWLNHKINPITYGLIDNGGYTYYIEIYFNGAPSVNFNLRVQGVKIIYTT